MSKKRKNLLCDNERLFSYKSVPIVLYCGTCLKEIEKKILYVEVVEDGLQFDRKHMITVDPSVLPRGDKCPACNVTNPMYTVIIPK